MEERTKQTAAIEILAVLADGKIPGSLGRIQKTTDFVLKIVPIEQVLADTKQLNTQRAVILCTTGAKTQRHKGVDRLLREIRERNLLCLLLSQNQDTADRGLFDPNQTMPRIYRCRADISGEELYGRLCMLMDYRPVFDGIEQQLVQLEHWALSVNNRFEELNQELRLAWRVQQDFLPRELPQTDQVRFATLYRPASWVSGDIYDIMRLDENHVGFYISDVVGHGVAAGLMTLFVKRGLITKEITDDSYQLVPPNLALQKLNEDLCDLELPDHQFITACYAMLELSTLTISVARAGHPHPILIGPDGKPGRIEASGPLLGVLKDAPFNLIQTSLVPGSKVIIYTDGLELAFDHQDNPEQAIMDYLAERSHLSPTDMVEAVKSMLDCHECSLHPADDVTMVVCEILPGA